MQSNARTSILAVSTATVLFVSAGCGTAASPQEQTALALLSTYAAVPGNLQHLPRMAVSIVDIATVEEVKARQQVESEPLFALAPAVEFADGVSAVPEGHALFCRALVPFRSLQWLRGGARNRLRSQLRAER